MDRALDASDNRRLSADVLERALQATDVMVALTDPREPDNPIVWVNDYFCRFTGYARDEIIGQNCRFLQADDRDQPEVDRLRDAIAAGEPANVLLRNYKKDGALFYNDLFVSPVWEDRDDPDSDIVYFVGVQNDVSARVRAQTDVAHRDQEIGETAENERERFGMDLHDGLGQELAGAGMLAQALANALGAERSPHAAAAREVTVRIRDAIASAHAMARGLNPVGFYPDGLSDALRELATSTEASSGLAVRDRVQPVALRDRRASRHLYRIAQEAVANAIEHADATTLTISFRERPVQGRASLVLEVADDGVGIEPGRIPGTGLAPEEVRARLARQGVGLYGMRYRADLIGATISVEPDDDGTVVRVVLPADPA